MLIFVDAHKNVFGPKPGPRLDQHELNKDVSQENPVVEPEVASQATLVYARYLQEHSLWCYLLNWSTSLFGQE